jgi:hypothetical protein
MSKEIQGLESGEIGQRKPLRSFTKIKGVCV